LTTCAKSGGQEKIFKKGKKAVCSLKNKIGNLGEWARAFGRMGVQHPHFLPLYLEVLMFHSSWRLEISLFFKFYL
jgi:hypothetical protein